MCEISYLDSNKAKRAIEALKKIGTKIQTKRDFSIHHVDRYPISNKGEYRKLYRGLSPDTELFEIKLPADARIFYFDIESKRTFYVVAITHNHLETDKVRH